VKSKGAEKAVTNIGVKGNQATTQIAGPCRCQQRKLATCNLQLASRHCRVATKTVAKTHVKGQDVRKAGEDGLRGEGQCICTFLDRVIDLQYLRGKRNRRRGRNPKGGFYGKVIIDWGPGRTHPRMAEALQCLHRTL